MGQVDWAEANESGTWNTAQSYSENKLAKPLRDADYYQNLALFGTEMLHEEFMTNESVKILVRIKALRRLIETLLLIIGNAKFAVTKSDDKTLLNNYKEQLKKIRAKGFPHTYSAKMVGGRVKGYSIDEEKFDNILEFVIQIKDGLNEPLNRASLIFSNVEVFDPKKMKKKIKEQLENVG